MFKISLRSRRFRHGAAEINMGGIMAKHNQSTSDHWKINGKGHSGENILHEVNKQQFAQAEERKHDTPLIPGQDQEAQHSNIPAHKGGESHGGDATTSANSSKNDY
jgi:hypothetical protein